MTTLETSNASRLAALIVATWVEPASECVFDAFGIRKACNTVSDMLLAEDCTEERGRKLDEIHAIWRAARLLDNEVESLNKLAREMRERLLKALQA